MSVEIIKTKNLHCQYERQTEPQGCYVELDCKNGTLWATYNSEIGNAIPFTVFHGHDQRFGIPVLTAAAADELLVKIAPHAERVIAGYTSEWDGNNNVARFTNDAQAAIDKITFICDDIEENETNTVQAWDAGDWLDGTMYRHDEDGSSCKWNQCVEAKLGDFGTITGKTTDAELDDMQQKIEDDLDDNTEINGLRKFLYEERDNCKNNSEDYNQLLLHKRNKF